MHPPPLRASWTPLTLGFPAALDWSLSNTFKLKASESRGAEGGLKDTSALRSFSSVPAGDGWGRICVLRPF